MREGRAVLADLKRAGYLLNLENMPSQHEGRRLLGAAITRLEAGMRQAESLKL